MATLPAHQTKHVRSLPYPLLGQTLHLAQSDDGHSTGTALWLGAQVLALYLVDRARPPAQRRRRLRAVELGSGVGLTALVLGALGHDVLATDTAHVCDAVLRHNIAANLPHLPATAGVIQVRELDWNVESDRWVWNDPTRITHSGDASSSRCEASAEDVLGPPFDLIVSSDTLYDAALVHPLFRTARALALSGGETGRRRPPVLLLALERRDPALIREAIACAPARLTRVPMARVRRAMERGGLRWDASDWEGVEIWRGPLQL